MFSISLGEIIVILLVALIFIKPEDIPTYLKIYRNFLHKLRNLHQDIKEGINESLDLKEYTDDLNNKIKTIIGEDGKSHIAYDLPEELTSRKKEKPPENG